MKHHPPSLVGIDIGGTLVKLSFALKKDDPSIGNFEHLEELASIKKNKK